MARTTQRGRKAVALAAVAGVLGVGVYSTLATWNDDEWVFAGFGGADGDPDIGTSTFKVLQNRSQAPSGTDAGWEERDTNANAGDLVFTTEPIALSPGMTLYAPVALRTDDPSVAGEVTLQAPVPWVGADPAVTDPGDLLWDALTYSVKTTDTATNCNETTWATFGDDVATDLAFDATLTAPVQSLDADAGSVQYYCFAVSLADAATLAASLPAGVEVNDLQGREVHPAWRFASESVS